MMKIKYALPAIVGLMLFSVPLWADPPSRVGRVSLIQGTVTFTSSDSGESQAATLNYPLTTGDQLQTAAGARAEAQIGSTAIRIAGDTRITFDTVDDQAVQLRLDKGSISVRLRRLDADQSFGIAAQTAGVSLPGPGSFRIDQGDNGDLTVMAREGSADVTMGEATVSVKTGQEVVVPAANPTQYTVADAPAPDSWDTWVASRDRGDDRSVSTRYVSSEVDGVEDLDGEGTWRVYDGYGPCWVPNVFVGWAPYHFGHWAWVGPWGWTWIDDAPWGFAPFHYGRWAYVTNAWVWVPGPIIRRPVYAPALVTWRGGMPGRAFPPDRDHISWVPLRPRQPFRPAYPVGPAYLHAVNGVGMTAPRPVARFAPNANGTVVRPDTRARVTPIPPQERQDHVTAVPPRARPAQVVRPGTADPYPRPVVRRTRVAPPAPQAPVVRFRPAPAYRAPPPPPDQRDQEIQRRGDR
jgi:hypothetical protein